ncbi:protein of unknown function [Gracilibacillus orientalis]|uniref:DUF4340 domain-containing protein n=1 Tax=Gracilibacillus orientalis TaxID=334253 RepID=A0A1I4ICH1_9BACI|nr:DUF4340 domain-containing protein [Gracilibacillus orientalis]SFL52039.1 protein of unknown function [Gracilibacillus orientalis]
MKKTRTLIYVLISIVGLSVLLFLLVNANQDTNDTDEDSTQLIERFEQITNIDVLASENTSLTKTEQGWQVVDAENEVDTNKMDSFLLAMEEMTGEAVEVDKKNVNLNFPKVVVSFTDQEGETQKIAVGQMHEQGEQYYVEHQEKETIYLVDRSSVEMIPLQRVALLNNKILTVTSEDVTEMKIDNGKEVIQLSKESPFSEKESLAHISGWYMHKPYQNVYSVAFSNAEEMVVGVDGIEQVETVNGEGDYGFADSDFSIVFSNGEKDEKLVVGDPAADNQYYVKVEGKEEVYTIPTDLLDPYSHQAYDVIDHFVHIVSLEVIDELSIETPEDQVTYTMEHEETAEDVVETTVFREGEELETEVFRDDYKQLAGLTFDEVYNGQQVDEEPEIIISYLITDENNETIENTIEFRAISDTHYAIIKNNSNQIDFTIEKDKLQQAIEWTIQAES